MRITLQLGDLSDGEAIAVGEALLRLLARRNMALMRARLVPMLPYNAGVRYVRDQAADTWSNALDVLRARRGDCEDLAAWVLAGRWMLGESGARPRVTVRHYAGYRVFHVTVLRSNGKVEDPSKVLGMGA